MNPNQLVDFTSEHLKRIRYLRDLTEDAGIDQNLLEDENRVPSYEDATSLVVHDTPQKNREKVMDACELKGKEPINKGVACGDNSQSDSKLMEKFDEVIKIRENKLIEKVNSILEELNYNLKFAMCDGKLTYEQPPVAPSLEEMLEVDLISNDVWTFQKRTRGEYTFTKMDIVQMMMDKNPSLAKREAESMYDKEMTTKDKVIDFLSTTVSYRKIRNLIKP